jgi:hypothetical protein
MEYVGPEEEPFSPTVKNVGVLGITYSIVRTHNLVGSDVTLKTDSPTVLYDAM